MLYNTEPAAQQQTGGSEPSQQALQQQVQQMQQVLELQEMRHKAEVLALNSTLQTVRCAGSRLNAPWRQLTSQTLQCCTA